MKMRARRAKSERVKLANTQMITLYYQKIPRERFDALSEVDRYCLLLSGHIHDELSWLQRTAKIAINPRGGKSEAEGTAAMMQITMLVRLLLGKLWEFHEVLEKQNLRSFFCKNFNPDVLADGTARVDEILAKFDKLDWLRKARNKHFLHYPCLGDVTDALNAPEVIWEFEVYHGAKSANAFYPTSDVFANYAWFQRVNAAEPMKGLEDGLDALTDVCRTALALLEQSIGNFIDRNLLALHENKEIKFSVPTIGSVQLPYFVGT